MAKTLQERFIEALIKRGDKEVKRTSKYIVFSRTNCTYYYLGKAGSLRFGCTIASSIQVSAKHKQLLLAHTE